MALQHVGSRRLLKDLFVTTVSVASGTCKVQWARCYKKKAHLVRCKCELGEGRWNCKTTGDVSTANALLEESQQQCRNHFRYFPLKSKNIIRTVITVHRLHYSVSTVVLPCYPLPHPLIHSSTRLRYPYRYNSVSIYYIYCSPPHS